MIQLKDISFQYPDSDFRLEFEQLFFAKGTKTALIGPSGFGKTTLLNLISGISEPQTGEISVHGKLLNKLSEAERRTFRLLHIGFVFQDFKLLEYLTVAENILLPYRINNALKPDKTAKERARKLAASLGIEDKLSTYPTKLSQGERQRAAVCRALIHHPEIILADEPTGNLDPENKEIIMNILFDYVTQRGSTLITVTHDHELLPGFEHVLDFKEIYKKHHAAK